MLAIKKDSCYLFILLYFIIIIIIIFIIIVIIFIIIIIIFLSGFSFTNIHESQDWLQEKEEGIFLTPHYHFHPLHRHLDISRAITPEGSPLHIASVRTRTGAFGFRAQVANHHLLHFGQWNFYKVAKTNPWGCFVLSLPIFNLIPALR